MHSGALRGRGSGAWGERLPWVPHSRQANGRRRRLPKPLARPACNVGGELRRGCRRIGGFPAVLRARDAGCRSFPAAVSKRTCDAWVARVSRGRGRWPASSPSFLRLVAACPASVEGRTCGDRPSSSTKKKSGKQPKAHLGRNGCSNGSRLAASRGRLRRSVGELAQEEVRVALLAVQAGSLPALRVVSLPSRILISIPFLPGWPSPG